MGESDLAGRLRRLHGFRAPASYVALIGWMLENPKSIAAFDRRFCAEPVVLDRDGNLVEEIDVWDVAPWTPVEYMRLFGRGDESNFGYLVLAPEIDFVDLPVVGQWDIGQGHVVQLGDSLASGLSAAMGFDGVPPHQDDGTPDLSGLFDEVIPRFGALSRREAYRPREIPAGYRFVSTSDLLGVLAPTDAFQTDLIRHPVRLNGTRIGGSAAVAEMELRDVAVLLRNGCPASAIGQLKEIWMETAWNEAHFVPMFEAWSEACTMLGRPEHALRIANILESRLRML